MAGMSDAAWQVTERLARAAGLGDAQLAGLAVGCPVHGNAQMDFDDAGVFCHECEVRAYKAERARLYRESQTWTHA